MNNGSGMHDGTSLGSSRRDPVPDLPTLEPGITLLETDADLGLDPLHALVVDRLLTTAGQAHWVDAGGHARTVTLREIAPHRGYLDRVQVARGFTAYQHASLVDRLAGRLADHAGTPPVDSAAPTDSADPTDFSDPALVVAPAFDLLYREDDVPRERAGDLLVRRLATLAGVAREYDVPVLVTRAREDDLAAPIANAADRVLRCEATPFGPRFTTPDAEDGEGHETLVYDAGDGTIQTTLAFWREVLRHRARISGVASGVASDATPTATPTTPGWD